MVQQIPVSAQALLALGDRNIQFTRIIIYSGNITQEQNLTHFTNLIYWTSSKTSELPSMPHTRAASSSSRHTAQQ